MAVLVYQLVGGLPHAVDGLHHVHRDTDGAGLVRDGAGDGLTDPPGGVGGEAEAAVTVKLFSSLDQADVALLDQVEERQIVAHVLLGNGHHQAQVRLAQAAAGIQAVAAGLEQLLALFVAQGAVLHGLHGFFLSGLFLGVFCRLFAAFLVKVLGVAAAVLVFLKREACAVLLDVLSPAVLLAVCLQDMGSLGTGMDAAAQLHLLLRAQQRDLADLLEVVLHGVIQQLVHGGLQVRRVLLALFFLVLLAQAQIVVVVLGVLHLSHDALHIQAGFGIFFQHLDPAFFQKGIERFLVHSALYSQRLGLLGRNGAFAFRQQFL